MEYFTDLDTDSDEAEFLGSEGEVTKCADKPPQCPAKKQTSMLKAPKRYTKTLTSEAKHKNSEQSTAKTVTENGKQQDVRWTDSSLPDAGCLKVGDRVKISGVKTGMLMFFGQTHFAEGDWCGIELDDPEGKHDGLVKGTRYFKCKEKHGIFVPVHKVEVFTEDLYMYDSEAAYAPSDISSGDERSPSPPDRTYCASESQMIDLMKPQHPSDQDQDQLDSDLTSKARLLQKTFQMKDIDSTDSTSSSRDSSASRGSLFGRRKPSDRHTHSKAEKRSATRIAKDGASRLDATFQVTSSPHEKKTKMSHAEDNKDLNTKFSLDDSGEDLLDVYNSSRVDNHTAHTLAYGLESVGSDVEASRQLDATFELKKATTLEQTTGLVKQPSLEWDPEDENMSVESSMGIITDLDKSTFTDEWKKILSNQSSGLTAKQRHNIPEIMETELDKEIAGMATPEIDVSGSTVSGKEDGSSPEPEHRSAIKNFSLPLAEVCDSKAQSAQKSAGEKLATPSTEVVTKDYDEQLQSDVHTEAKNASSGSTDNEKSDLNLEGHTLDASFVLTKTAVEQYASLVKGAEEERSLQDEKVSSLQRDDVTISWGTRLKDFSDVPNLEEVTMPEGLLMSLTDDNSPDDIYVDVGDPPQTQQTSSTNTSGEHEVKFDQNSNGITTTKQENIFDIDKDHNISEPEGIRCATNKEVDSSLDDTHAWQSDMDHVTDAEQLMADLKASRLQCRPASMVSSSSADTGIALDDKDVLRERPISMVSTSSADTGYQAEQDGEGVSIATSYPLTESSDVLMETDVNMDTLVLPENADAPTDDRIDVLENKPDYRDDLLASDRDQASSPEGATVDSEHGEISGTESQQELAQKTDDETTVQEAVSPENAVELEQMLLESDNTVTGQQMNDVLPHLKDNRPDITMVSVESEAMDTEMVESATMKDVMEKCVAIEHDQLVHNIQVEAHIEMREPFLEEPRDLDKHDEHENDVNMDKEEDEETNEMAVDGDSHIDVRSSPDAKLDQEDTPCESINVSSPRSREVASKTLTERKQARQVNERTKRPASGGLKRPGSSYTGRKRKDDNSVDRSVLQTKSLRHPAQVNASMKTETKSAVAKLDTHKVLPKSSKSDNLKADSEKRIPPSKISKDVSNKKKSERNPSKIGLDKKGKQPENLPDKDKEKRLAQARKDLNMLQSVPSEYIAPHLKTIEAHPVLDAGDGERKKSGIGSSSRSSLGQRKMATVRSKIDSGLKSASKLDSKPAKASTSQVNPTTKPGLSSRSSLRQPVAGMKRTSVTASSGSRLSRLPLSNPRPVRMSRPVSGSQQSLVSDHSGRESQGGAAGDHTSSSRKPSSSSLRPSLSSAGSESPMLDQVLDVSVSMGISQGQQSATASAGTRMTSSRRLLVRRTIREPSKSLASVTSSQTSTSESPKYRLPQATSTPKSTHSVDNSKSQKGGTTSTSVPSMKRPRQPDVVNNTLKKTNSLDEITRLEALCESRTKELNKVKILLRKRTTGFEAMIAIVKYLTDELNAFSCPMITAQLAEAQEQVKKSVLQLEELTKQRDAVIDEIQSIKQQHAEETESLIAKHQQALLALTDKLVKEKEDVVNEVIEKHSHEVNALKSYQERTMREIEEKHEKSIAEKKKQYEEELTRLKREHEKQINDLHCDHESKLNEITMRFETIKLNLLDKVEKLRIEGEELRQREAAMTEKCQRESDYKIQCALAHYKKEVESLNTVLELRASECHQLRKQVLEMQKELEKLPVAQEKIKSQEQQIENLQAIIDLRADNERSLTQKHNVLLRKYDKETKVTKRLSLDREELMWRLQEYDASGGVRRSISHSPTGSETSTPETIRRHRSPLPHSPHSPCDPKRSPLQKVPPQGSLKRTGTYEVLPQEYDDMNNLKQSDI